VKRIAVLHYAAPPITGGTERIIYHHLRLLHAAGYDLRVITGKGDEGYYETSFSHSVDFHLIPLLDPHHPEVRAAARDASDAGPVFSALRDRLVATLRPLLQNQDICLVHSVATSSRHLPLTAALHQLASEGTTRLAAWSHDYPVTGAARPEGYPESLPFTAWPGVEYVAGSHQQRASMASILGISPAAIRVIPSGIDPVGTQKLERSVENLVERLDLLASDPLILLPCCRQPGAEEERALEMLAHLRSHKDTARLLVVDLSLAEDGSSSPHLEGIRALRQRLGLEKVVHFLTDWQDVEDRLRVNEKILSDLLALTDLLLFPQFTNASSCQALLAAALARVPVFTAGSPLIQEITGGLVQLIDPGLSPAEMAHTILDFLENDRSYQLRQVVLRRYSWEAIFKEGLVPLLYGIQPPAHALD
jgi:mannosylglucosylglycerate synthase